MSSQERTRRRLEGGRPRQPAGRAGLILGDATEPIALRRGRHTLGRSRSCDICVPLAGLRPRHARFVVGEAGVAIERLEADAEIEVNGIPVSRAEIRPGDAVRLGGVPARLVAAVAEVDSSAAQPPTTSKAEERPPVGEPWPERWLTVLEGLHDWSRSGAADRRGPMLGLLVDGFGLAGAALLQRLGAEVSIANGWGEVASLVRHPLVERLLREPNDEAVVVADQPDVAVATVRVGRRDTLALAVRSNGHAAALRPVLGLALRFLAHEQLRDRFRGDVAAESLHHLAFPADMVVGRSSAMLRFYGELRAALAHRLPVLLVGETGSGKGELVRVFHLSGPRAEAAFRVLDCTLPEPAWGRQLDSLLGNGEASRSRLAAVGTLVFDGIDALAPAQQARLSGALDTLARRTGGEASPLAPRIVATATVARGEMLLQPGGLRSDLYFRLAGFVLRVPALRERPEDLPLLLDHFLCRELGPARPGLAPEALESLIAHRWPGNVRELRYLASRVAAPPAGRALSVSDLAVAPPVDRIVDLAIAEEALDLPQALRTVEQRLIGQALRRADNRLGRAAELLGISRTRMRRRMRELGLASGC
jgi:DNA-binding NtrC family response regulator